jgi:hypothetical protein
MRESEIPDRIDKSFCSHRKSIRAARICSLVSVIFFNSDSLRQSLGLDYADSMR